MWLHKEAVGLNVCDFLFSLSTHHCWRYNFMFCCKAWSNLTGQVQFSCQIIKSLYNKLLSTAISKCFCDRAGASWGLCLRGTEETMALWHFVLLALRSPNKFQGRNNLTSFISWGLFSNRVHSLGLNVTLFQTSELDPTSQGFKWRR